MQPLDCKFVAGQAHSIHIYKNIKEKVQRCCASIYFNQQCLHLGVTPKYANIKVPFTSPASKTTQKKSQVLRIKTEIKFLYSKKDKLNAQLYKAHLNAAQEWGSLWPLIQNNILHSLNSRLTGVYKTLDKKLNPLSHIPTNANNKKCTFFQRVNNLTNIEFTDEESILLNKGMKYNLGHRHNSWIQNLGLEAECAITLLPPKDQEYMRLCVAKQIEKIHAKHPSGNYNSPQHSKELRIAKPIRDKLTANNASITKANKGSSMVIIYNTDYEDKVMNFIHSNNAQPTSQQHNNSIPKRTKTHTEEVHNTNKPRDHLEVHPIKPQNPPPERLA